MKEMTIPVSGMTCDNCVAHVEKALRGVEGVADVQVDLEGAQATVHFSGDQALTRVLAEAVSEAGYSVPTEDVHLQIGGMSCDHCVNRVTQALRAVPGVVEANVDLEGAGATVITANGVADLTALEKAVDEAGYQVVWS